jgi:hypothetical protein
VLPALRQRSQVAHDTEFCASVTVEGSILALASRRGETHVSNARLPVPCCQHEPLLTKGRVGPLSSAAISASALAAHTGGRAALVRLYRHGCIGSKAPGCGALLEAQDSAALKSVDDQEGETKCLRIKRSANGTR